MAIYLKFKGISAKGFDTLHLMGLTMSHKWSCDVVERISNNCMSKARNRVATIRLPLKLSYDNCQLPFRVISTRLDNLGEFGSGTAATVYFSHSMQVLSEDANQKLCVQRAEGLQNPLTEMDLLDLTAKAYPHIQAHAEFYILQFLLDAADFDFKTYPDKKSDCFKPPSPIDQLPCGPEHATLQYILGTVNISETSYEDNSRLIYEWLTQLGWKDKYEHLKTGIQRLVIWCGDQLTMDRLRGLFKYRAEDESSFERLDYTVLVFGWLHLQMAFANSLHKQYLGSTLGRGLRQAFTLLKKKGLNKVLTKGPFHHDLEECLYEVAAAHFREDWLQMSGEAALKDLQKYSPAQLRNLAHQIFQDRASVMALNKMEQLGEDKMDEQLYQIKMWNHNILHYIILDNSIQSGDVGMMEHMLPYLYHRFQGGGNGKYAIEVMELLQGLHREWTAEVW